MRRLALRVLNDDRVEDIEVRFGDGATVGQLTDLMRRRAGHGAADAPPLGVIVGADGPAPRFVPPGCEIVGSGLRSGQAVRLAGGDRDTGQILATLSVVAGPDAPRTIELRHRTIRIGRGADSDVRLDDPLVSRRHARLHIGESVELVDDGSVNGIRLGGNVVDRALLGRADRVALGDTVMTVARVVTDADGPADDVTGTEVPFHRSPRVDPDHRGIELTAPEPPQPPADQRFPIVSLLVPIAMAVAIFAATESVLAILFVGLSPLLVVGSWLDARAANRRQLARATTAFRAALADLDVQLRYAASIEGAARRRQHPAAADLLSAAEERSSMLWCRRPEHDGFAQLRLGLASRPSVNLVAEPPVTRAIPELVGELRAVTARYAEVAAVPVVADLDVCGNVGIAGPEPAASAAVRALVVELAGLHAPTELVLAGVGADDDTWAWLAWLPHVHPAQGPLAERTIAGDSVRAGELCAALAVLIDERAGSGVTLGGDPCLTLPLVVVVVDDRAAFERSHLVQIAERGPSVGVHVVWWAASRDRLPAACRAFLDVSGRRAVAGLVASGEEVHEVVPEQIGERAAERFARRLSPLVDSGAVGGAGADLPTTATLVDLVGAEVAGEPTVVAERWSESGSLPGMPCSGALRALVGRTTTGPLHLDLLADGPHALVGGTTGSGKSELLQTWVAALAVTHSPARVNFLLVDYKGGAAFAECVDLPHCVGLVTDLDGRLVTRALRSLDAELRRRERLLRDRNAKDLRDLERRRDPDRPPRLVIVVDEFAALVADVPEFVEGIVGIAQRGRSLGLHLVLATQRPAGVVSDQIRANTDLRIALRVADPADSIDVIGTPDAAGFERSAPGRALVAIGGRRPIGFQTAYVGGRSAHDRRVPALAVRPLHAGGDWSLPPRPPEPTSRVADLARIVDCIRRATDELALPPPRRPWLAELGAVHPLPASSADELAFGVLDDPDHQVQRLAAFRPAADGNMAVFGTGGAGKSTALRTIAAAAATATIRGDPVWVYAIDFASRGLHPIEELPNVGSVVPGDDHDRVARLLRTLAALLDERAGRPNGAGTATPGDEPRIVLLVDGIGAMRAEYEGTAEQRWWDVLVDLATRGRSVGIHLVVAADRPAAVPSALAAVVQRRLVLRSTGEVDLALLGVPPGAIPPGAPAGRGWLDGCEVQVAVPGGVGDVAGQAVELARLAQQVPASGRCAIAPPVQRLPERVPLGALPVTVGDGLPVIGLDDETLAPIGLVPEGTFVVAGPPRSGRTTALATIVRAVTRARPGTEPVLLGRRRSMLSAAVEWSAVAADADTIGRTAIELAERLASDPRPHLLVVIEAVGELLGSVAEPAVHELVRASRDTESMVVAEGETAELSGSWPLLHSLRGSRAGVVLHADALDGEALFKIAFPRPGRGPCPPGRGVLVRDGRAATVQVALPPVAGAS